MLLLLTIGFHPMPAWGLNLEWAGGPRDLEFTSARRCTLIVFPSAAEMTLPAHWRLYWTGNSELQPQQAIQFLTMPGPSDALPVCAVEPATTDDDRLSNTSTVEFCEPGDTPTRAAYVLLLDPSLHAKFKVVGETGSLLDFNDSSQVTVNGGGDEDYPAALRLVSPLPDSAGIARVGIAGQGLDRVQSAWLYAPGSQAPSHALPALKQTATTTAAPLPILSQTATTLTVAVPDDAPPAGTLVLSNGDGQANSAETLEGILGYDPLAVGGAARMVPPFPFEAKDFSLIFVNGQYHIFYMWLNGNVPDSLQSIDVGHAVSTNLYNWTQLPHVVPSRPGKFDAGHIWAPTVIENNGVYYMYYTGVSKDPLGGEGVQSIGRAISTDLEHWTQEDQPVLACADIPWSDCDASSAGKQFRDPFAMFDPSDPTHELMFFVARLATDPDQQLVGVADTHDLAGAWANLQPMWCTDKYPNNFLGYNESPHVFQHGPLWYLMFTTSSGHPIRFKTAASPLADSLLWSGQYRLYDEVGQDPNSDDFIASEHLTVQGVDYLAVVDRAAVAPGVEIRMMTYTSPPHFTLSAPPVAAVSPAGPPSALDLRWVSAPGSRAGISLQLALPGSATGRIEVFDVAGRSVARLWDGWLPSGLSHWTWDGRLSTGGPAGSGVYFARVRTTVDSRTIRVALLR